MFPGSLTSFEALRRTIERYCKENTHAIFADTMIEDEDLYRFLADQEWYFGITIERVKDGRTPWQVMKDEGYIMLRLSRCKKEMQRIVYSDNFHRRDSFLTTKLAPVGQIVATHSGSDPRRPNRSSLISSSESGDSPGGWSYPLHSPCFVLMAK